MARVDEGVLEGMRAFGASAQDIAAARDRMEQERAAGADDDGGRFAVDPDNWDSVMFFCSVGDQWAYASRGGMAGGAVRTGLPANRVEAALRMQGVPRRRHAALWADVQTMVRAVLAFDAEGAA